ncbi:hypothetical protein [Amycolatopsis palatopharyngis]|uniref:hypothetical protein n=1 Tax=Amycolatopsis palatopharyngis TaxID=187982 RepID=UPI000E22CBD4|nr:hypothetical protein [Amycolatopsis palatopharyngis]
MAYATAAELASWMGLPSVDETRADLKLDAATGLVEDDIGQSLVSSTDTVELTPTYTRTLVLPRWPVTAITSVVVSGETLVEGTDYTWETAGLLIRVSGCWDEKVTVVYTAGWDPIPASVKGLVLEVASGSWGNVGAKKSEKIGDYSASWVREGMSLSTTDRKTLARYSANR